jgi:uncharacterized membrane protein
VRRRRAPFPDPTTDPAHAERVASRVAENIEKLAAAHASGEERGGRHQQAIEHVTHHLGRPGSVYVIVLIVSGWVALNLNGPRFGFAPFDPPPFYWLQGLVSLSALLTTTMILTTQNRQSRHAKQRAMLDLEINLLAERKATKIIALLEELRRDLPNVHNRVDPVADAMSASVDPVGTVSPALEVPAEAPVTAPELVETNPEQ